MDIDVDKEISVNKDLDTDIDMDIRLLQPRASVICFVLLLPVAGIWNAPTPIPSCRSSSF